jgi:hypothetical protein
MVRRLIQKMTYTWGSKQINRITTAVYGRNGSDVQHAGMALCSIEGSRSYKHIGSREERVLQRSNQPSKMISSTKVRYPDGKRIFLAP